MSKFCAKKSFCVVTYHARIIIGFLSGADQVELSQVSWECLRAVDQHLFQTSQVLQTPKKFKK